MTQDQSVFEEYIAKNFNWYKYINRSQWLARPMSKLQQPLSLFNMCMGKVVLNYIGKTNEYDKWLYNQIWVWAYNKSKQNVHEHFKTKTDFEDAFYELVWTMCDDEREHAIDTADRYLHILLQIEDDMIKENDAEK